MPESTEYDCVIIGGGPAGISCALELIEHKRSYVLLDNSDRLGGQLDQIHNTIRDLASGFFENGKALKEAMLDLAQRRELNYLVEHQVTRLDALTRIAWVGQRRFHGKAIVVATGSSMRRLEAAGADRFSADTFYQTEFAEDLLYGHTIAVVGGGDSAFMEAMELARQCPRVYLIHRGASFNARDDVVADVRSDTRIEILPQSTVVELHGDRALSAITIRQTDTEKERRLSVNRLVVKIGYQPNCELLAGQVDIDEKGFVQTDINCETSVSGIYAAGDNVHPGYLRIAPAMGQGIIAANHIHRRLQNGRV